MQISPYLRRADIGHEHWCPGCGELHLIPNTWTFDGNIEVPTFNPSVKITGKKAVVVDGEWTGEWERDAAGNTIDYCCHYFLHAGKLQFCGDSSHKLSGEIVDLPQLPKAYCD
jgi:hypothetical protein